MTPEIEMANRVAIVLVTARVARGMTQMDVVQATGVDQPTLSKLERGLRPRLLSIEEQSMFESALGLSEGFIALMAVRR